MHRDTQKRLLRTAVERIRNKETDLDGGVEHVAVERYISREWFEREQRTLFRRFPLVVGFASQLERPGDYLTHDLSGVPLLVTRNAAGELRAFINACRHRGTRIEDGCGSEKRTFVCPYHAWSYDLDGRLRGLPHARNFPDLDREAYGLVPLPVCARFGLVFVVPSPGVADFDAFFASLHGDLDGFADHVLYAPSTRDKKMNWKVVADGSWETYHFRKTHENSIAPYFFDDTGVFDWEDPHLRMVLPKRTILDVDPDRDDWSLRDHANLLYSFFPNAVALVEPDHAMVIVNWPTAPGTTTIAAGMLIPEPPQTEAAESHWRKNERIFWHAIEEDIAMGERIQQTLESGANPHLTLGRNEHLIAKFEGAIERAMNAE